MTEYEKFDSDFRNQNMTVFNNNPNGLLWLKVRSIGRIKQIRLFCNENGIILTTSKVEQQCKELFDLLKRCKDGICMLDVFLRGVNHEWYTEMGVDMEKLKNDLYLIQDYSWGGDQNNSLDRYLVSRYVKVISDYIHLQSRQSEIGANAWNYVQNSWYNNWTSFVIESLFKRHPKVISAAGEIKGVDFFLGNYPLDLKVTFFPAQFMEQKVKRILGRGSLSWLKATCKEIGISCDSSWSPNQQFYALTEKLKELGKSEVLSQLASLRRNVIEDAIDNPLELIKWLYEHQGEMRFGAENRIYLVLADVEDMTQSWKMKRAFSLIEPKVKKYIDDFTSDGLKTIKFEYKNNHYMSLADTIFVVK